MRYSGADWIKENFPNAEMSQLGICVANLLGELVQGIYHMDTKALQRVEWHNRRHIEFLWSFHELATTDFDELSRLVFLAHHTGIRVSIAAARNKVLKLTFHQRGRVGSGFERHPDLNEAVDRFKANCSLPEWKGAYADEA